MGKQWKQWLTLFLGAPKSLRMVITAIKLKDTPWKESYDQPRWHIEKQRHYFASKDPSSQGYGFSSGHVWMWELDCEESWVPKNWRFWSVVLGKTLESPLDCKEIQPVHPTEQLNWTDGHGGLLTLRIRNMRFGQGPTSSFNCLAIFVLGFQSIENESLIALGNGGPAHLIFTSSRLNKSP